MTNRENAGTLGRQRIRDYDFGVGCIDHRNVLIVNLENNPAKSERRYGRGIDGTNTCSPGIPSPDRRGPVPIGHACTQYHHRLGGHHDDDVSHYKRGGGGTYRGRRRKDVLNLLIGVEESLASLPYHSW